MRQRTFLSKVLFFLALMPALVQGVSAQALNCTFKKPLVYIHFGQGPQVQDINSSPLFNYERVYTSCPVDGHYSFTSYTSECFHGDWFTLTEDHTPGDAEGNMMLVNAYPGGGQFLTTTITGLSGGTTYEFATWIINVCEARTYRIPLPPNITILLKTPAGREVARFQTGELVHTTTPEWKRYAGIFTMPANEKTLILTMQDNAIGGRGNDFAIDDITIRECVKTPVTAIPKGATPPIVKGQRPTVKTAAPKEAPVPGKKSQQVAVVKKSSRDSTVLPRPVVKERAVITAPVPTILRTRANPLIKTIETGGGEIRLDLYDNGEIDGDTVSIYHNNELIVSRAKLSQKPVTFRIMVDAAHRHHELVMVANNLGSIPPNTSLMIITAQDKRYQVFISSSEEKNAKVVIDLKE